MAKNKNWIDSLPPSFKESILWSADHEEGNFEDWLFIGSRYPGGGVFNTGANDVSAGISGTYAHSGRFSAKATISNAYKSKNGNRAVRLMRWTDKPWDKDGQAFPTVAYYSSWLYFPETYNPTKYPPWDPGDGGWWNVFQFKSNDEEGVSQPIWVLNVGYDETKSSMLFYLYSKYNSPHSYEQSIKYIPVKRWVNVEIKYTQSSTLDGGIVVYQDGEKIFDIDGVKTILNEPVIMGLGNYTDHIEGEKTRGAATIYFDDVIVSRTAVSPFINLE